eukprot:Sspe_Gene.57905::Locus_31769_Transcript_1_2_Confidence_0.200_Length_807::g.57905::m.57905
MSIPAAFFRSSVSRFSPSHCSSFHVVNLCIFTSDSRTFDLPFCIRRSHIPASRHGHLLVRLHLFSSYWLAPRIVVLHDVVVVRSTRGFPLSSSAPSSCTLSLFYSP